MSTVINREAPEVAGPADQVTYRHWILIFLLLGSTVINFLDRQTLSILAPTIKAEFQMSNTAYGWVITAFQVSYLVMYSVGGRLADLLGVRKAMIYFVSWWSVACISQALIVGPKSLAMVRSLLAVGEGGNWPAAVKAVAEQIPGSLKSVGVGIVNSGSSLGAIIAAPMVTGIALALGWRAAFVICGCLGLVWLPLWIWQTRGYRAPGEHTATTKPASPSWGRIFRSRQSWAIFAGRLLGDQVWFFWVLWFPLYLSEARGQNLAGIGRVAWIPFAGAAIGNYVGGGAASWLISRGVSTSTTRRLIMNLAAGGSSLGIVAAYTSSLGLAVAAATFSAFFYMSWAVNLQTMTVDFFPASYVGTVFGFAGSGSSLGTMLAAPAIGAVLDKTHDYGPLLIIVGLLLPVTQLIVMLVAGSRKPLKLEA